MGLFWALVNFLICLIVFGCCCVFYVLFLSFVFCLICCFCVYWFVVWIVFCFYPKLILNIWAGAPLWATAASSSVHFYGICYEFDKIWIYFEFLLIFWFVWLLLVVVVCLMFCFWVLFFCLICSFCVYWFVVWIVFVFIPNLS